MRPASALRLVCVLALATMARAAQASEPEPALEYDAPPGCPAKASFLDDVHARVAERSAAVADAGRFRVRIVEERGSFLGALETLEPPSTRTVAGATCGEVVRALVVFVALAISPEGGSAPPEVPAPSSPPAVAPPPPSSAWRPSSGEEPERDPAGWLRPGLDLGALAGVGIMPGLAPGGAVSARLAWVTGPRLRWTAHAGGLAAYVEQRVLHGSFDFAWYAARLDVGPTLELGSFRFSAGPAARAGVLAVQARALPEAGRYSSFWADAGGFLRVDRKLSSLVAVSLMLELAAPLRRRTFGVQRIDDPVHEIAPVIGLVTFGVALGR